MKGVLSMTFYSALQLDPAILKQKIKESTSTKEKNWFIKVIIVRAVLIVLFAIIFISLLSRLFGNENSAMAVVLFCTLLGIRFVDFGYRIKDSLVNLGVVFLILLIL